MNRLATTAAVLLFPASIVLANGIGTLWLSTPEGGDSITMTIGQTATIQVWMTCEDPGDGYEHTMFGMDAGLRHWHTKIETDEPPGGARPDLDDELGLQVIGFNPDGVPGPYGDNPYPLHFGNHGPLDMDGDQVLDQPAYPGNLNEYFLFWGSDGDAYSTDSGLDAGPAGIAYLLDEIIIEAVQMTPGCGPDYVEFHDPTHLLAPSFVDVWYGPPPPGGDWQMDLVTFEQGVGWSGNPFAVTVVPEPGTAALLVVPVTWLLGGRRPGRHP